jgi:hypothetical protein
MAELDKRLDECHRLQNTALDLSGLKIEPTDAIKVAAVLPQWCVKAVISPGKNTVHAMTVHGIGFTVLALIRQTLRLDSSMNSVVRIVWIA